MNDLAAARLWKIGVAALLLWIALLTINGGVVGTIDADAVMSILLLAGIGLIVASEVAPILQSLKVGEVELTFVNATRDKFLDLEKRVATLELATNAAGVRATAGVEQQKPAPALDRGPIVPGDQWKNRFGGKAEAGGYQLRAEFRNVTAQFVEVVLTVAPTEPRELPPAARVEFYLHESFHPSMVPCAFLDGRAQLTVVTHGGFTVGAWLPWEGVELELDLASVQGAPRIIRDL